MPGRPPLSTGTRDVWRDRAACKDTPALFFAEYPDYGPALAICATCPVVEPCREDGKNEPWGIWGGTVPEERGFLNGQRSHSARLTRRRAAIRASSASAAS